LGRVCVRAVARDGGAALETLPDQSHPRALAARLFRAPDQVSRRLGREAHLYSPESGASRAGHAGGRVAACVDTTATVNGSSPAGSRPPPRMPTFVKYDLAIEPAAGGAW